MADDRNHPRDDEVELLRGELDRLRAAVDDVREQLKSAEHDRAVSAGELGEVRAELERSVAGRREERGRLTEERDHEYLRANDLEDRLADAERVREDLEQRLADTRAAAERRYDRLRNRRVVRLALWVASLFRPLFAWWRRIRRAGAAPPSPVATGAPTIQAPRPPEPSPDDEAELEAAALARLAAATAPGIDERRRPLVSIVVLNRDGEHHLRRLLPALADTAYDDLELIVVDNASSDGSRRYLADFEGPWRLTVVANTDNRSFSEGNNQGIARSHGRYVLLLNNDVVPAERHWLSRMVRTAVDADAAAVGARLVYPPRGDLDNVGDDVHPDLTVQHRGVHFVHTDDGIPLPRNAGAGEDPLTTGAVTRRDAPCVTAACLLVRRDALEDVGGFTPGYVYGTEDVDLCLKLTAAGHRIVYAGEAVLWHHEFGTQNVEGGAFKGANRARNRRIFVDRWGPRVYRQVLLDRLRGDASWSEEDLRVSEVGDPDAGRADAVVVRFPEVDLHGDVPRHVPTVALVRDGEVGRWLASPWFDDLDVVCVASDRDARRVRNASSKVARIVPRGVPDAAAVRDALAGWVAARRVAVLVSTPGRDVAESWGDTHFGRALQRQFERRGHPTRLVLRDEFHAPWLSQADVAVHLLGLTTHRPRPGQVNVLWNISHPELVDAEMVSAYDVAFVASRSLAGTLDRAVEVPVHHLNQATDPEKFAPDPTGPAHELLFVANSRQTRRDVVDALVPTRFDLAVYGNDWFPDLIDPRHVRGEVVPNAALAGYYTNAAVVLNDHWPAMREHGFISNRLYDVLAAGGFVVSDDVEGLEDEFDGAVVTFSGRDDLHAAIERFLSDPAARAERGRRGRRAVLSRHTFAHRAATILDHVGALLPPATVAPVPGWAAADAAAPVRGETARIAG